VFDGEPYGGSVCPALQRTDLCRLEHLRLHDGKYLLKLANMVDETQHTDEFKLMVADHPTGSMVVPDALGRMHTVSEPVGLLTACDGDGRDVSDWLSDSDRRVWESDILSKDPDTVADLRDTLFLTFPRPAGARRAKLVVNGCNSLWASQMLRRFLELQGNRVHSLYDRLETEETRGRLEAFFGREELFLLKVCVWEGDDWVERGAIVGGGPFISEDRVITLDLGRVEGDELRIRLRPPAGFWRLGWLAVDYSDDVRVDAREVSASSIVGDDGRDLLPVLAAIDGDYYVMPETGQTASLSFDVPSRVSGMNRTVFAKVTGYYDIRLEGAGHRKDRLLSQIFSEPSYVVKYSLEEYLDWREHELVERRE
jgi:hypothetical protein